MLYIGEMNVSSPFSVGVSDAHRRKDEGYGIGVVLYANYWKNCVVLNICPLLVFFYTLFYFILFKGLPYSIQLKAG